MPKRQRVLVVGCGRMGSSHAHAYRAIEDYEIVGLADKDVGKVAALDKALGGGIATFADFDAGLAAARRPSREAGASRPPPGRPGGNCSSATACATIPRG